MRPEEEVKKQLDAVVGDSYEPPRNWRATLLKWLAAAVLAVVASVAVVSILHKHTADAQKAAAQKRPVPVYLIPPK